MLWLPVLVATSTLSFTFSGQARTTETVRQPLPSFRAVGAKPYTFLGAAVAGGGDVDGDGYSDILVSEHSDHTGSRVICRHGSSTGIGGGIEQSIPAYESAPYFGLALAVAGDVNADGFADAVVSSADPSFAAYYDDDEIMRCAVYYGSPSGLSSTPSAWLDSSVMVTDFGIDVESVGDVNGDGVDDVIVGSPARHDWWEVDGSASLYLGSANGIGPQPAWVAVDGPEYSHLGASVAAAGDVDLDGLCDVAFVLQAFSTSGKVIVHGGTLTGLSDQPIWESSGPSGVEFGFRKAIVAAGADFDGNGSCDLVVSCPEEPSISAMGRTLVYSGQPQGLPFIPSMILDSHTGAHDTVRGTLCIIRDSENDGYDDLLIGSPAFSNAQDFEGNLKCFRGSSTGLASEAAWVMERDRSAGFGTAVANAGDTDGDGDTEFVVGADQLSHETAKKPKYAYGEYIVFERVVETTRFTPGDRLRATLTDLGDSALGRFQALEGMKLRLRLESASSAAAITVRLRDSAGVIRSEKEFDTSPDNREHVFVTGAIGESVLEFLSTSGASIQFEFTTLRILRNDAKPKHAKSLVISDSKTKWQWMRFQALAGARVDIFLTKSKSVGSIVSGQSLVSVYSDDPSPDLVPYTVVAEDGSVSILDVPIESANEYAYEFGGWSPKSNRVDCRMVLKQPPSGNDLVDLSIEGQP